MHARLGESRRWFAAHIGMAALSVLSVFAAAPLAHADFMAIVDDGFDDSDIGTNPLGVGSGHTLLYSDGLSQGGWVGESDSQFRADIRGTPYYWDWAQISSKDKALNVRQPGWTTRADWQVSFAGVSIAQPYHFSQFPDGDPAGTAADIYSEFGLVSGKRSNIDAASDDLYRNIQGGLYVSLFYDLGSGENNLTITGNLRAVNKNHPDFGIYEDSPGLVTLATFTLGTRDFISGNPSEDLSVRMEIDNDGYRVGLYNFSNGSEIDPSNLNGSLSGTWSAMQSILDGDNIIITDEFDNQNGVFASYLVKDIRGGEGYVNLDRFTLMQEIPEPSALVLLSAGALSLSVYGGLSHSRARSRGNGRRKNATARMPLYGRKDGK